MRLLNRITLAAALLAMAAAAPRAMTAVAQDPQTAPTFRSGASLIEVDVIVRSRDGAFVEELTVDDFELLEDGRPHPIQQFYLVKHGGPAMISNAEVGESVGGSRRSSRMFVLVFDLDHLSSDGLGRLKRAAETFIKEELGPTDVAGVVAEGRIVGGRLTNQKHELLEAIKSLKPTPDSRATRMRILREFPRIDSEFEASRIADGDVRLLREATERICGLTPATCQAEGGNDVIMEKLDQKARRYIDEARRASGEIVRALSSLMTGLGRMPGRKTAVLLTEGFYAHESMAALQQIAGQAARSGVAVYGLDGRGLGGSGTRQMVDVTSEGASLSTTFDAALTGPDMLAGGTGGVVIRNASNFAGALGDIARDTSTYYVLGYAPANQALDGSFRKIEVRVKSRPGVQVRARKGYLATPLPPAARSSGVR